MSKFEAQNIRNVAIVGHSGEGKTSLAEAMLFNGKAIDRMGKTTDGNTVMDFDEQEIARGISVSLSVAYAVDSCTNIENRRSVCCNNSSSGIFVVHNIPKYLTFCHDIKRRGCFVKKQNR